VHTGCSDHARLDTFYVQNDITIRLHWSIDRNYTRTNNERSVVNQGYHHPCDQQEKLTFWCLMIIIESLNVLIRPQVSVIRITNI